MKKIWLIFKREYFTRVKKKSFIILTLLVPLSLVLIMSLQFIILTFSSDTLRIAVKDDNQQYILPSRGDNLHFIVESRPLDELKNTYKESNYDGILHIPAFAVERPKDVKYHSDNLLGVSAKTYIQSRLRKKIIEQRIAKIADYEAIKQAEKVSISIIEEGQSNTNNAGSTGVATGVGMFMGMTMYIVIFIYGSMVMRGVMEEKTNRIVEVMLSSVRPFQLMFGKILGIGAVGITQFGIWAILLIVFNLIATLFLAGSMDMSSSQMAGSEADMEQAMELIESFQMGLSSLPIGTLLFSFFFYFITGYLIYAALFAALTSAIDDESDAQTLTIPVSIPVVISFFILMAMLESPNTSLAFWSSMIPLSAPIIMPARIAFGVPTWEIALSMSCMIIGTLFFIWLAAKIYRVGILMYGKKVTFREIGKWMVRRN